MWNEIKAGERSAGEREGKFKDENCVTFTTTMSGDYLFLAVVDFVL
jgi:hypothetical protein